MTMMPTTDICSFQKPLVMAVSSSAKKTTAATMNWTKRRRSLNCFWYHKIPRQTDKQTMLIHNVDVEFAIKNNTIGYCICQCVIFEAKLWLRASLRYMERFSVEVNRWECLNKKGLFHPKAFCGNHKPHFKNISYL